MEYQVIQSNSAVNVIDVDGEIIQLSAAINIGDYLACKFKPLTSTGDVKPKACKSKMTSELADK